VSFNFGQFLCREKFKCTAATPVIYILEKREETFALLFCRIHSHVPEFKEELKENILINI